MQKLYNTIHYCIDQFRKDQNGNIVITFSLCSVMIFCGIAAGIDLARAYLARQKISEVAALTCQYSTRPSVAQTSTYNYASTNGFNAYVNAVNAFAKSSLISQNWGAALATGAGGQPGYFTATPAVGGNTAVANVPTNPVVEVNANLPTIFGKILNISYIPVHSRIACQTLAIAPQIVNPPVLLSEGFETPCAAYCFSNPSGGSSTIAVPTQTFPPAAAYIGYNGYKWYIVGYCLETDHVGVINATVPEGAHSAELDCDNGSGSAGNSSISTSLYLEAGQYELRYNYRSRIDYPDYDPTYICGSTDADVSWANDTNAVNLVRPVALRTNQINVYLDANLAGTNGTVGSAPLHKTIDGTQYLAGSNLIDMCVYAPTWIERSVRVKVTTPGYYWLSFAADGTSDSYGGQLDNIRLCQEICAGALQDNFPPAWLGNKTLFEDTFDLPVYTQDSPPHYIAKGGNLNLSVGTSGNPFLSGWPSLAASGWATAPFNQITYALNGAYQGSQYIALDGYNASGSSLKNRLIGRSFLLDPGYYQVSYDYISMVNFSLPSLGAQPCTYAPPAGSSLPGLPSATGQIRYYTAITTNENTNIVTTFMANSLLVSTPIGGGAQSSQTSYLNPDGSVSLSPVIAPDGFNANSYNPNQANPIIDFCLYSDAFAWLPRTVAIKITKTGNYWLFFSAQAGTSDGNGGGIDDVKLTALGSPYMLSPPSSPMVAIPAPAPQSDSILSPSTFSGFSIVADPFTPPGADQ